MTARRRLAPVVVSAWLCATAAAPAGGGGLRSGAFEPPRPAPDFALPAADGAQFRLSRHRGKVVALTFGYTSCPDVCPTVLAELAQVRSRLGAAERRVQVVYVSVDPERDTAERMRAYTGAFDRTFAGLTGSPDQLAPVWKAYGIALARRAIPGGGPGAYAVHHSAAVHLIDAQGRLRVMAPFGTPVEDVLHDVRALLAEGPAASIVVDEAWVRRAPRMPDGQGKTAAYLVVDNRGAAPDALLSAAADVAARVEIHETRDMAGMMTMAPRARIAVRAGARVELKPGGYHLMLVGLTRALAPGETVTLTLTFERAGRLTARAEVR